MEIRLAGIPNLAHMVKWSEVDLYDSHKPALQSAKYSIHVLQTLKVKGETLETSASHNFEVAGEQL